MSQPLAKSTFLSGKSTKIALFYGALALVALIWFTPVITLVITALKDAGDFAVNGAFSLPKSIRWSNFSEAWDAGVKNYFWNSVIVTGIKVPLGILIESLAAFALTHLHFKWANQVFTHVLIANIAARPGTIQHPVFHAVRSACRRRPYCRGPNRFGFPFLPTLLR